MALQTTIHSRCSAEAPGQVLEEQSHLTNDNNSKTGPTTENGCNSDDEVMRTSHAHAGVKKNKSSLYLIKSYSFIDRSNQRRPASKRESGGPQSPDLTDLADLKSLLLEQPPAAKKDKMPKTKAKASKKLTKSKSTNDSCERLDDLHELLRKPALGAAHGNLAVPLQTQRPHSMPVRATTAVKSAGDDAGARNRAASNMDAGVAIKRDSFIRHSLQTIRRSFTTHKKHTNGFAVSPSSSASSSTSSTSSTSSSSAGKDKDKDKDKRKRKVPDVTLECSCPHNDNNNDVDVDVNAIVDGNGKPVECCCDSGCEGGGGNLMCPPPSIQCDIYTTPTTLAALEEEDGPLDGADDKRSTSSVSTLAYANPDGFMAPLQSHAEAQSVACLNTLSRDQTGGSSSCANCNCNKTAPRQDYTPQQKRQLNKQFSVSGSTQSDYSTANSSSVNESYQSLNTLGNTATKQDNRSLRHSSSNSFLSPSAAAALSGSIRSLSPSRKSVSSSISSTAKHEQQSTAAANAAAATPPEKEKKRKEVSSSRVKKFHRHFSQVSKDEKLINYFSCALVSDILLQGHLYITDQHFAFYSNVFGYVTKVVIPTSSVTKISKEKTAKIIPNAVGVATADERHVFGSFISREAAFRLMCSVCPPLAPAEVIIKTPADIEISEEYSIEDDSSCSISGNESPPQAIKCPAANGSVDESAQPQLRRTALSASVSIADGKVMLNDKMRHSDIPANVKAPAAISATHPSVGVRASAPPNAYFDSSAASTVLPNSKTVAPLVVGIATAGAAASAVSNLTMIIAGSASSTTSASSSPTPSSSSLPTTMMAAPRSTARAAAEKIKALSQKTLLRLKFPSELHVVYLGVLLSVVLALFSVFLLYRILDIEAKTSLYHSPADFNWRSGNDDDIFAEALRWQKELQTKSTEEAQTILNTNLEQIAKVRRSLETLSMLIHDRSSAYATTNRDDSD